MDYWNLLSLPPGGSVPVIQTIYTTSSKEPLDTKQKAELIEVKISFPGVRSGHATWVFLNISVLKY